MPTTFPRVNAGDVITAVQWNQVLAALEDIYSQIGTVSSTGVAITGFTPPGPVKAGDMLTILGRNFEYTIGAQSVFFGGVPINTYLLGSSDTQLVINVPDMANIPAQGQSVTVTVYNRTTSDSKQIEVVPPPVSLTGGVPVSGVPFTGTPTAGQTASFSFVVTSNLSTTRAVNVTATVTPASLQPFASVLNASGNPYGQLSLQANASVTAVVALAIPTTQAGSFTITVNAVDVATGTILGSSGTSNYTIGQQSQTDPNIQFGNITLAGFSTGQGNALQGNVVTLPASGSSFATIAVETTFLAAAKYDFTTSLANVTGWTVTMLNPPPPAQELDFSTGTPPVTTVVRFRIDAASPAAGSQLQMNAQTNGQTKTASLGFTLATS